MIVGEAGVWFPFNIATIFLSLFLCALSAFAQTESAAHRRAARRHSDGAQDVSRSHRGLSGRPARFRRHLEQDRHRLPPDAADRTKPGTIYEKAIKLNPKYAEAINNLGTIYYAKKSYRRADQPVQQGAEADSELGLDLQQPGHSSVRPQEIQGGFRAYQKALSLDPEVFEHRSCLRHSACRSARSPRRRSFHYYLAKTYASAGNVERAIQYIRMALEEGFKEKAKADGRARIRQASRDGRIQGTDGQRAASVVKGALLALICILLSACSETAPRGPLASFCASRTSPAMLRSTGWAAAPPRQIAAHLNGAIPADSPQPAAERQRAIARGADPHSARLLSRGPATGCGCGPMSRTRRRASSRSRPNRVGPPAAGVTPLADAVARAARSERAAAAARRTKRRSQPTSPRSRRPTREPPSNPCPARSPPIRTSAQPT